MQNENNLKYPIKKHTRLIYLSAIILIVGSILNLVDKYFIGWSYRVELIGFLIFGLVTVGLIPLAISIREITDIYFVDHVTKEGKETARWLWIYGASVAANLVLYGWFVTAIIAGFFIIFGRVIGFIKLNKLLNRIKNLFGIKLGSVFYVIFGYFSIIVATLGTLANWAEDVVFSYFLFALNGIIESILIIIVAVKLIIDFTRIQKFILTEDIKPYSAKSSLFERDRKEHVELSTTKEHVQTKAKIAKLQERTRSVPSVVAKKKTVEQVTVKKIEKKELFDQYIICPKCNERTDKNLGLCTNCGVVLSKKEIREIEEKSRPALDVGQKSRRILSVKKEKILQQIVIAIFLITFVTYSFITDDAVLITYSWIIIAIFVTYMIVNYILLFLVGSGFAILTAITDILFMFVILPILSAMFSYFALTSIGNTLDESISHQVFQGLMIGLTLTLSIFLIFLVLRFKVKESNMNLREYLQFRFDFKARAAELNVEKKRVEKKRTNFDKLDQIEAHMKKQREERVMDYKDFDYKERLKDLGSPLKDIEQDDDKEN
ncbi:MAG: hypothetical protein KAJ72_05975 [Candidatus Heimdallarchaeota archaeon]|nr:hypothetical protein [Candidatus Heimdallarchaeota archaeon]